MSGSGQEAVPDVRGGREALPDVREWSGDVPGLPVVVGRPYRMSGSGGESLSDFREWSEGPRRCTGVIG